MARNVFVEYAARRAERNAEKSAEMRLSKEPMSMGTKCLILAGLLLAMLVGVLLGLLIDIGDDTPESSKAKAETITTIPPPPTTAPVPTTTTSPDPGPPVIVPSDPAETITFTGNPYISMNFNTSGDGRRTVGMQLNCNLFDESDPLEVYFELYSPTMEMDLADSLRLAWGSWDDVLIWASNDPYLRTVIGGSDYLYFELTDGLPYGEVELFADSLNKAVSDADPCDSEFNWYYDYYL